jgi:PTH1 family peptidyl-tRNA hydrolase
MLLWVGLGNPEPGMARQRHNVGFMAVDTIAIRHGFGPWRARFKGLIAEGSIAGEKVIALKPMTYMNDSGDAVQAAAAFYKLPPEAIAAFHDELDLAPGKMRVKRGGGAAGHNGLRSMDRMLGSSDYWRVRLGIGHPGSKERVLGHVLSDFAKVDRDWLVPLLDAVADAAPLLAQGMLAEGKTADFMTKVALLTKEAP